MTQNSRTAPWCATTTPSWPDSASPGNSPNPSGSWTRRIEAVWRESTTPCAQPDFNRNRQMYKPKNVDDYVELINQALFEVDELVLCAEDEGDGDTEFTAMMPDLRVIEAGLEALQAG